MAAWQAYRGLFPVIPERSRFNRRRRALQHALNDLRRVVAAGCERARVCVNGMRVAERDRVVARRGRTLLRVTDVVLGE